MENIVCKDLDGESAWVYDPENKSYARYTKDGKEDVAFGGKHSAKILGKFLPEPDSLWLTRCKQANINIATIEAQKLKPSPTTYALWKHWVGVKDA